MKKHLLSLVAVVTSLAGTTFASTQTFTAVDTYAHGLDPGVYLTSTGILGPKSMSDVFNLTADGFVPGVDTAISGTAYFDLTDYLDPKNIDRVSINLGSIAAANGGQVHNYAFDVNSSGGPSDLDILADINADGELDFSITAAKGNFFVADADLTVLATVPCSGSSNLHPGGSNQGSTPDAGSTMNLLGLGLAGLATAARKFGFSK